MLLSHKDTFISTGRIKDTFISFAETKGIKFDILDIEANYSK